MKPLDRYSVWVDDSRTYAASLYIPGEKNAMKAQIIPCPPPPREVVVTMSEEEAKRLYMDLEPTRSAMSLLGWPCSSLYQALHNAGIQR